MTEPRVLTEELGGTALSLAVRRGELSLPVPRPPKDLAAWGARARELVREFASTDWFGALRPALEPGGEAAKRLAHAASQGIVVTTGQQPGLFGGPLMTITKALSALAMADVLERSLGLPVAAVFWAATDDADFDEACWAQVAVIGGVERFQLVSRPPSGTPLAMAPLQDVRAELERFEAACGGAVDVRPLQWTRQAYASGATTIGAAYVRLLRSFLEPLGMAVLDASHQAVRTAGAPVMERALDRAVQVSEQLHNRVAALSALGFPPQVEEVERLSLVFTADRPPKRRIRIADAAEEAKRGGGNFSPNVLLRPVVERSILPTICYVGGPGEIAYFAQVEAVADALSLPQPLVVPRWSGTIIEPRVSRVLNRLGADASEFRDAGRLAGRLARSRLPAEVAAALGRLRANAERDVAALEVADDGVLVPPASIQSLRQSILHRIERMERRLVAAVKRTEGELLTDIATGAASLYPNGVRQERALSFVPFLARYGTPVLNQLRTHATEHAAGIVGSVREVVRGAAPLSSPA